MALSVSWQQRLTAGHYWFGDFSLKDWYTEDSVSLFALTPEVYE